MNLQNFNRYFLMSSFLNLFLIVLLGALASHALEPMFSPKQEEYWQTGLFFHAIHALGIGLLAVSMPKPPSVVKTQVIAGILIWIGIVLFSGGLYLLALGFEKIHFIIPFGGISWLMAWGLLSFYYYPRKH